MLGLDNGDKIRGDASVASVVDYTLHGLVGTVITQLADGQLPAAIGDLYTAASNGIAVTALTLVNTDSSARTVNLYLTPSGGTARRLIPKDLSLAAGSGLVFDGQKVAVLDSAGKIHFSWATGETLLAGGLPAALDSGALKIKEQSPLSGFATSSKQDTIITALQIIDDFADANNKIIGYYDRDANVESSINVSGAQTLTYTPTLSDEILWLQGASCYSSVASSGFVSIDVVSGSVTTTLGYQSGLVAQERIHSRTGPFVLKSGDSVRAYFSNLGAGSNIYLYTWGYRMKI